jgi:hypothetical protein
LDPRFKFAFKRRNDIGQWDIDTGRETFRLPWHDVRTNSAQLVFWQLIVQQDEFKDYNAKREYWLQRPALMFCYSGKIREVHFPNLSI